MSDIADEMWETLTVRGSRGRKVSGNVPFRGIQGRFDGFARITEFDLPTRRIVNPAHSGARPNSETIGVAWRLVVFLPESKVPRGTICA